MTGRDPDRGRTIYLAVLAAMLTSVATTYGLRLIEGALSGGDTVDVPALIGLPRSAASELVQSRGLRLVVTGNEESVERAADEVLRQQPLAGSQMPSDGAVEVVLSSGTPQVTIPEVVGRPVAEAKAALEAAGLVVGAVNETGEGAPGTVTALSPPPGSDQAAGSSVIITASPDALAVPEVIGMPIGKARTALTDLGLAVGRVRYDYVEARPEFQVLRQDPDPGTRVDPGHKVDLVVNE